MHRLIIILFSIAFISGASAKSKNSNNDIFNQVNAVRQAAKMIPLSYSRALSRTAQNHANYLTNNIGAKFKGIDLHSESKAHAGYTGATPSARARIASYPYQDVKENISVGSKDVADSVSGLMSGIYHRFTFLDFLIDDIGYGTAKDNKGYKSYVYNMGRKDMESVCESRPQQAKPKKPFNCLGNTVSAEYMENACANLPQEARYDPPFPSRCPNGRLLKSSYMKSICQRLPAEIMFGGSGSYVEICDPAIRVKASWFNQLCNTNGSPALHSGDNRYYEICENKTRVYSSWLKNYCDSATPIDQSVKASYYLKLCHSEFKVSQVFSRKLDAKQYEKNPNYVIWPPYKGKNVLPVFYDEIPDPLPDLDVSGYPLSVQFNPGKVKTVSVKYFKLQKKTKNGKWRRIKAVRELNHITDPEKIFSKLQFAWYPLKRLDWNATYRATVYAKIDGEEQQIRWNFKTKIIKTALIKVKTNQKEINVPEGEWFTLYVVPSKKIPRSMQKVNLKWRGTINVKSKIIDLNTIKIIIKNSGCRPISLNLTQGRTLKLTTCKS